MSRFAGVVRYAKRKAEVPATARGCCRGTRQLPLDNRRGYRLRLTRVAQGLSFSNQVEAVLLTTVRDAVAQGAAERLRLLTPVRCVRKLSTGRELDCGSRPYIARVRLPHLLDSRNEMAPQGGRVAEACAHGRCAAYRTKLTGMYRLSLGLFSVPEGRGEPCRMNSHEARQEVGRHEA